MDLEAVDDAGGIPMIFIVLSYLSPLLYYINLPVPVLVVSCLRNI